MVSQCRTDRLQPRGAVRMKLGMVSHQFQWFFLFASEQPSNFQLQSTKAGEKQWIHSWKRFHPQNEKIHSINLSSGWGHS